MATNNRTSGVAVCHEFSERNRDRANSDIYVGLMDFMFRACGARNVERVLSVSIIRNDELQLTAVLGDYDLSVKFNAADGIDRGIHVDIRNRYAVLFGDCFTTDQKKLIDDICEICRCEPF